MAVRNLKLLGGGGQSDVQKGTLLLLMMIWHKKNSTFSQKGHFFLRLPGVGGSCPLPPPARYGPVTSRQIYQCRKFEGNLAEASIDGASRSCGGGGGGGEGFWGGGFSLGSCLGCLNTIYGRVYCIYMGFLSVARGLPFWSDIRPHQATYRVS